MEQNLRSAAIIEEKLIKINCVIKVVGIVKIASFFQYNFG